MDFLHTFNHTTIYISDKISRPGLGDYLDPGDLQLGQFPADPLFLWEFDCVCIGIHLQSGHDLPFRIKLYVKRWILISFHHICNFTGGLAHSNSVSPPRSEMEHRH